MREKYESLALADLKAIAKARGLKGTSAMKKDALIELMLAEDEKDKAMGKNVEPKSLVKVDEAPSKEPASDSKMNNASTGNVRQAGTGNSRTRSGASNSAHTTDAKGQGITTASSTSRVRIASNSNAEANVKSGTNLGDVFRPGLANGSAAITASGATAPSEGYSSGQSTETPKNTGYSSIQSSTLPKNSGNTAQQAPQAPASKNEVYDSNNYPRELDSGVAAIGILEVMPDGYGFIRCENFLPGENDVYVAPSQIRKFGLKTGDYLVGNTRLKSQSEKFAALLYVKSINGYTPEEAMKRANFEDMTPIFPNERIKLERPGCSVAMRVMDLISPVGKGQRGMIVSQPKAGKTTLLKEVAKSVKQNNPDTHLIILLIDERPEEVTDIKEAIQGPNVEVIYSTFDELPEHHKRVSEMVIERGRRLVEHHQDVMILIDSITRLTRAYNLTVAPSGRTLSGGLDPAALHMPKRFFGAARNMREGGSLTILATALVETGSKMDDVVYEEFKGTGNMELVLDRKLSEKRIFPAIDIPRSGTRREDLLLSEEELKAVNILRKAMNVAKPDEAVDQMLDMISRTRNNNEFVNVVQKTRWL